MTTFLYSSFSAESSFSCSEMVFFRESIGERIVSSACPSEVAAVSVSLNFCLLSVSLSFKASYSAFRDFAFSEFSPSVSTTLLYSSFSSDSSFSCSEIVCFKDSSGVIASVSDFPKEDAAVSASDIFCLLSASFSFRASYCAFNSWAFSEFSPSAITALLYCSLSAESSFSCSEIFTRSVSKDDTSSSVLAFASASFCVVVAICFS